MRLCFFLFLGSLVFLCGKVKAEDALVNNEPKKIALKRTVNKEDQKYLGLKKEATELKERIVNLEKENAILEAMLEAESRELRPASVLTEDDRDFEKVIHLNLGFAYGKKGKTEEAIYEFRKALKYDPDDTDIHYNLGYLLSKQKKYREAIEEYKKSLSGLEQDKEAFHNLAIIYSVGLKDQKTAQEYFAKSNSPSLSQKDAVK